MRSGQPGANRPDRLIRHHHPLTALQCSNHAVDLRSHHRLCSPASRGQALAHAHHRQQAGLRAWRICADKTSSLSAKYWRRSECPTRVKARAQISQHGGADLAGVGAVGGKAADLPARPTPSAGQTRSAPPCAIYTVGNGQANMATFTWASVSKAASRADCWPAGHSFSSCPAPIWFRSRHSA